LPTYSQKSLASPALAGTQATHRLTGRLCSAGLDRGGFLPKLPAEQRVLGGCTTLREAHITR
jgi:hypothetical protein